MNSNNEKEIMLILDKLFLEMQEKNSRYIGFPNSRICTHEELAKFLQFPINNIGDPFHPNAGINTCLIEQEMLDFFRQILNLDKEDFWGYLTNGGTEGNIYGLYQGRELYPEGILYYSEDAHYSLQKIARFLRIPSKVVPSQKNGEMDYEEFFNLLKANRDKPAIINANIGTTMKGAIDDVRKIVQALEQAGINKFYIHCDAALFGIMLPFMDRPPAFDFREPIGSMAISGHKFLGSPIPCGVLITRNNIKQTFEKGASYVGSIDTTVSGSRDGFSVLVLWSTIKRVGLDGLARLVKESLELTRYALEEIRKTGLDAWVNHHSTTIVIKHPGDEIVKKWQLAFTKEIAHLVILPGVTEKMIDLFVNDLKMIKSNDQL